MLPILFVMVLLVTGIFRDHASADPFYERSPYPTYSSGWTHAILDRIRERKSLDSIFGGQDRADQRCLHDHQVFELCYGDKKRK